jgi:hypothetical protein
MRTPNTIATRNGRIEYNGKDEYLTFTINGSNTCVKVGTKEYLVRVDDLKDVGGKFQPFFTIKSSDEKLIAWASKQGYRVAKSKKGYVVKGTANNTLAQFRKMCLFLRSVCIRKSRDKQRAGSDAGTEESGASGW